METDRNRQQFKPISIDHKLLTKTLQGSRKKIKPKIRIGIVESINWHWHPGRTWWTGELSAGYETTGAKAMMWQTVLYLWADNWKRY